MILGCSRCCLTSVVRLFLQFQRRNERPDPVCRYRLTSVWVIRTCGGHVSLRRFRRDGQCDQRKTSLSADQFERLVFLTDVHDAPVSYGGQLKIRVGLTGRYFGYQIIAAGGSCQCLTDLVCGTLLAISQVDCCCCCCLLCPSHPTFP